jgi:DNA-binding response OmpR family regulator
VKILFVSNQASALHESMEETLRASGHEIEPARTGTELASDFASATWDVLLADVSVDRENVLQMVEAVCAAADRGSTRVVVAGEKPELKEETAARLPYAQVFAGFTRSDALLAALD